MKTILMTAYDIDPYRGSESGTGWNFIIQSARFNRVIAITRKNNRTNIEKYINQNQLNNLNIKFFYFDLPYYLRFWKKGSRGSSLYFYLWQMFIPIFIIKNKIEFDIAHNVNFHADAFPTFLWILRKPVVWGPINHNEPIPKEYLLSNKDLFLDRIKWLIKLIEWNFDPFMYLAKKNASIIIGGNSSVKRRLKVDTQKFIMMSQVASSNPINTQDRKNDFFDILVAGRFINIKSIDIAIYAFDNFFNKLKIEEQKIVRLLIIGKGPKEKQLKNIVEKLNSNIAISFLGWIDKNKMEKYYQTSSIFVFPSHEGAGLVIIEALSFGLPIICFRNYGPGELVNEDCAIRIPYTNYKNSILDYSNAMMELFKNKNKRVNMSNAATKMFLEKYTWDTKGDILNNLYNNI